MTPRMKLERLLACQQKEKDGVIKKKDEIEKHLLKVKDFRSTLTNDLKHELAINKAEQAIVKDREALEKIEEQIKIADLRIEMTLRALRYLAPEAGGVEKSSSFSDMQRRYKDWRADGENESRYLDGLIGMRYGFVVDPALVQRLSSLVNRLQVFSSRPDVSIQVRILATESGIGPAAATATTIYFDKAYLEKNPSESELLFITGHELAHVQLGHFSETIIGREEDSYLLGKNLGPEGIATIKETRTERALLKMRTGPWEQRQEEAADLLGALQALDAGASPQGIHDAMIRMDAEEKTVGRKVAPDVQRYRESLRDHPIPLDRLKALETEFGEKFWERNNLKINSSCD